MRAPFNKATSPKKPGEDTVATFVPTSWLRIIAFMLDEETVAERDGNGYMLNGAKTFISNGQNCDMVIVVAKTDRSVSGSKGISLLMVDDNADGFVRGRNLEKIGLHSADTSELFFDILCSALRMKASPC